MKYAVLAALLATVSAADKKANGCKPGITGKLYSDTTCKTEVKSTFTLMEHHVKFTGDCVTGKASTDQVDNAATAASNFKKAQRETKKKLDVVNAVEKIQVDDATKKEDPKTLLNTLLLPPTTMNTRIGIRPPSILWMKVK